MPEIERARDNLVQSGKPFGGSYRRDSMPMMGGPRAFSEFGKLPPTATSAIGSDQCNKDPRMSGMPHRHHSVGDYEHMRPGSGGSIQSFYASQRHQPRQSEAEQVMQAKRRMAAQRERELRNYHQEQQYNRRKS